MRTSHGLHAAGPFFCLLLERLHGVLCEHQARLLSGLWDLPSARIETLAVVAGAPGDRLLPQAEAPSEVEGDQEEYSSQEDRAEHLIDLHEKQGSAGAILTRGGTSEVARS